MECGVFKLSKQGIEQEFVLRNLAERGSRINSESMRYRAYHR